MGHTFQKTIEAALSQSVFEGMMIVLWLFPLIPFGLIGCASLIGKKLPEKVLKVLIRSTTLTGLLLTLLLLGLEWTFGYDKLGPVIIPWIRSPILTYDLVFASDRYSLGYVAWSWMITGVIGRFSSVYLQGMKGYQKFMVLLLILQWGVMTVVLAARLDLLMLGWEVVGLASVLLIGFIQDGRFSGKGSLTAFASYKVSDIGLLLAGVWLHHLPGVGIPYFHGISQGGFTWPPDTSYISPFFFLGVCLIFGSLAKSSQFPFVTWLPRAMEGPTPSSAAFYGALSVHLGPILLLKLRPFWAWSDVLVGSVIGLGVVTILYGTLVGKTLANYKSQLAYAIMVQLGLINIEIAVGLEHLALWHICGHGVLRTFQFLRAGSILQEFAENPAFFRRLSQKSNNSKFNKTSKKIRGNFLDWLYSYAWNEFKIGRWRVVPSLSSQVLLPLSRTVKSQGLLERVFIVTVTLSILGLFIFPLPDGIRISSLLGIGLSSLVVGFDAKDLKQRIFVLAVSHIVIFGVFFHASILAHSKAILLTTLLIFILIATLAALTCQFIKANPDLKDLCYGLGLAQIFPEESVVFLAGFLILGISPGSMLFLAEDMLLEHLLEFGYVPLGLFLGLGLVLAIFLYRTYVQVFMGYDPSYDSKVLLTPCKYVYIHPKNLIRLARVLILALVLLSILPQSS